MLLVGRWPPSPPRARKIVARPRSRRATSWRHRRSADFPNYGVVSPSIQMGRAGSGARHVNSNAQFAESLKYLAKADIRGELRTTKNRHSSVRRQPMYESRRPTKSKMRISNIPAVASFLKLPDPSDEPSHRCPSAPGTATSHEGGYSAARTASTGLPG